MDLGRELKQLPPEMDTAGLVAGTYRKRARRRGFIGAGLAVLIIALIMPLSTFLPNLLPENQQAGDWPGYSSLDELLEASDAVVLARATGERSVDVVEPTHADDYDPNDPEQNPHLGTSHTPDPESTRVEFEHFVVEESALGGLPDGGEIRVGTLDDGPYPIQLEGGSTYVMFLADVGQSRYHVLNPSQAIYVLEDDGLHHVVSDHGETIAADEVEDLFDGLI